MAESSNNLPFEYQPRWQELLPLLTSDDPLARMDALRLLEQKDRDLEEYLNKDAPAPTGGTIATYLNETQPGNIVTSFDGNIAPITFPVPAYGSTLTVWGRLTLEAQSSGLTDAHLQFYNDGPFYWGNQSIVKDISADAFDIFEMTFFTSFTVNVGQFPGPTSTGHLDLTLVFPSVPVKIIRASQLIQIYTP